jgi:CheY-like chemotaxis protein
MVFLFHAGGDAMALKQRVDATGQVAALASLGGVMRARMRRVLIVDDDAEIRHTMQTVLTDDGCHVTTAPDGTDALRILRASPEPLPVFLDVMMPRMDGVDVLRAVQNDPSLSRHVFTMMTAAHRTLPMDLVRLMQQLNVDVIWKPFDDINMLSVTLMRMEQRLG